MNILINETGALANVLAWKLAESKNTDKIYCKASENSYGIFSDVLYFDNSVIKPDIEIPLSRVIYEKSDFMETDHIEIPVYYTGSDFILMPAVYIYDTGKSAFCDTGSDLTEKYADLCHSFLCKYINAEKSPYFCSLSIENEMIFRFRTGMSSICACAFITMLKGDMTKLYNRDKPIENQSEIQFRSGASYVAAFEGDPGQYINGLSKLEGDIGVFINEAAASGSRLRLTGKTALYLCARNKDKDSAKAYLLGEAKKLLLTNE